MWAISTGLSSVKTTTHLLGHVDLDVGRRPRRRAQRADHRVSCIRCHISSVTTPVASARRRLQHELLERPDGLLGGPAELAVDRTRDRTQVGQALLDGGDVAAGEPLPTVRGQSRLGHRRVVDTTSTIGAAAVDGGRRRRRPRVVPVEAARRRRSHRAVPATDADDRTATHGDGRGGGHASGAGRRPDPPVDVGGIEGSWLGAVH